MREQHWNVARSMSAGFLPLIPKIGDNGTGGTNSAAGPLVKALIK
jgi:hypothetical protein